MLAGHFQLKIRVVVLAGLLAASQICSADDWVQRYYASVFSGDLSWMREAEASSQEEAELLEQFEERFLERRGTEAMNDIDDPLVREVASQFMNYWVDSLLAPETRESREVDLERSLEQLLKRHEVAVGSEPILDRVAEAIRDRGYGYQGGRTRPFLDFILWRESEIREFTVELTDRTQPVEVHFLRGFISQGWSHFATFGRSGTGGWADDDALYCIEDRYDLSTEAFLISYLKHEARHFADYEIHPDLESTALEYRAKLTELSFARQDQMDLLNRFTSHANEFSTAPHPQANWQVVSALAARLGLDGVPDDPEVWERVAGDSIRGAARELLVANERRLTGVDSGNKQP